ncbi:MAG: molecular chaperone [Richelia sp. RM1_1_1]|nr:molecular chaperone [Richelia sp. RM1_1_1]
MPLEIRLSHQFQLRTKENDNLSLELPLIGIILIGDNTPHLNSITCTVRGTPPELAAQIQAAYKQLIFNTPSPLSTPGGQLPQNPCKLNKPIEEPVNCTLQVDIDYFDSDASGQPLKSARKYVAASCYLWFPGLEKPSVAPEPQLNNTSPQTTQPPVTAMNSAQPNHDNEKRFPGWLAVDFGTCNSTVTLFDPNEVPISNILPIEQEARLRQRLGEWLSSAPAVALPDVNILEWEKFIVDISKSLEVESSELGEVIKSGKEKFLEAIRQIELCLGSSEKFRRAASKKLHEIYHEVFRVPTLESQNLIPVVLDSDRRATEIKSELGIVDLTPLEVIMGEEASEKRNKAIALETNSSFTEIISRFYHSPKRYFGQEREFTVTLNGEEKNITVNELIQAAWGHLKDLTEEDRKSERRNFSEGEFRTAVVTYPTVAPPIVRKQVKELVEQLGIDDVQIAYDEAVSVAIFFLWREFGGNLNIGIESFKTRCRRNGNKWLQNVLVVDIGGGTTDIALIELTLEDQTPDYKKNEDRGLGGRYYKLTPKLLGSSGHLQLGGELITLRTFLLLKAAIGDRLLTEFTTGNIASEQLEVIIDTLDKRFLEEGKYKSGSLLECLDKKNPESKSASNSASNKDALDTAEKVVPTRWAKASQRLQSFYLLWEYAEKAKLQLGKKPADDAPLTFTLDEQQISQLLAPSGIKLQIQDPSKLSVTLDSKQFEQAATAAVKEAIGITTGLVKSRLDTRKNSENDYPKEKVDWLILSGKTCNLHIVEREIYQEFSKSEYFVWNPERITFVLEYTKLATSAGACYAEKLQRFRFDPEESRKFLCKGANQLEIDVKNLFYYLPCNFKRSTQKDPDPIFDAGQELYQLSPLDSVAKTRTEWLGVQLSNIIYRQDYEEGGELRLWGSYDGNKLRQKLQMTEAEFLKLIKIQFEIDQNLQLNLLLVRGKAQRLISKQSGINVGAVISKISGTAETPALFIEGKLKWTIAVERPQKELNNGDIAVNVLESATVDSTNSYHKVFETDNGNNNDLEVFRYQDGDVQQQGSGLISKPLPAFPQNRRHTFYLYHEDTETNNNKWIRIGELEKPPITTDFPCQYRVTLDEQGVLRMHAGEVLYWTSESEECLKQEGCVFRAPLQLQESKVDRERDPFCGFH